jgi:hypothetical protein
VRIPSKRLNYFSLTWEAAHMGTGETTAGCFPSTRIQTRVSENRGVFSSSTLASLLALTPRREASCSHSGAPAVSPAHPAAPAAAPPPPPQLPCCRSAEPLLAGGCSDRGRRRLVGSGARGGRRRPATAGAPGAGGGDERRGRCAGAGV